MIDKHLLEELEFVLTHPDCNVDRLENFYNNCLLMNEYVPIYAFVTAIKRINPSLLIEWSSKNKMILTATQDLELNEKDNDINASDSALQISIDLAGHLPTKGYYKVIWSSELGEEFINKMFKRKAIRVIDRKRRDLDLVGFRFVTDRKYALYIKVKEESA
ncbi:hypothetical protein PUW24_00980 (plasmid) [Paenibacillus urinalis]|uniref:Uncharacterized protein n=1 Tax=Paenibacillus urinalis TaxID=521520 RepID=A0AAX3N711_9BACL|nr:MULTISPECIES: hypothetical protein [Paenibacillus]MCM3130511.1 hypothetical protein [Paenibacillus sp. MER 78]WDH85397.1 hypothetical protein PUW23_25510 [Paenibacillus urinalis]WDH95164.1 hypothetical protein PUW24_00980 [Paenibacillus urinalis]WDI05363.1 hypothetical protein PUW25_26590 [Paenibacillus urinalis]